MRKMTLLVPIAAALALGGCAGTYGQRGIVYGQSGAYSSDRKVAAKSQPVRSAVASPSRKDAPAVRAASLKAERPAKQARLRKEAAPRQVASLESRDVPVPKVRPKPAEIGTADRDTIPDRSKVASGDEILASLLRTWNTMVGPNSSSKVLFDVWPEQVDGKLPTRADLGKRLERTRFDKDDLVAAK